jgi:hypothetical protein
MRPGHKRGDRAVRAYKEVSWLSVTAALPRNTGTSITTPSQGSAGSARNGR